MGFIEIGLAIAIPIAAVVAFLWGRSSLRTTVETERLQATTQMTKELEAGRQNVEKLKNEVEARGRNLEQKIRHRIEEESSAERKDLVETRKSLNQERREIGEDEKKLRVAEAKVETRSGQIEFNEKELDRKLKGIEQRESGLAQQEMATQAQAKKIEELEQEAVGRLERVAEMSAEEAKEELVNLIEGEARNEAGKRVALIESEAKEDAEKKAKKIIAHAIQRWSGDHVSEVAVTVVPIPNDELKGRVIGREGRNIRALEAATGVDVIIDDTPECITVSAFNPIRREVARLALESLVADGRIHPGRIEEVVEKAEEDVDNEIKRAGEQAIFDTGLHNVHPEVVKLVGRLKYRYSYGQNQWKHALETSFICGAMAAEMGLNEKAARRSGLLHDIGKTLVHDQEGSHAVLGARAAKKYGEHPKIIHAIAAHHEEEKPSTLLALITQSADCLSGARPGARMENVESYIKRLEDIERIATGFRGVEKCFAMQAGREVRVMVGSQDVSDSDIVLLSRDIAQKIESDLTYPGQIRVTVIRETRASEYAR